MVLFIVQAMYGGSPFHQQHAPLPTSQSISHVQRRPYGSAEFIPGLPNDFSTASAPGHGLYDMSYIVNTQKLLNDYQ